MGLAGAAFAPTRAIVRRLLNDRDLRELVIYNLWQSENFDKAKGFTVPKFASTVDVKAIRLRANERSARQFTGGIQAGDVIFMFYANDMPAGISKKDQILDAKGNIFVINEIIHVFGIVVAMHVEGKAK